MNQQVSFHFLSFPFILTFLVEDDGLKEVQDLVKRSLALDDVPKKAAKPKKKLSRIEKKERKMAEEKRKELIAANSKEKKKLASQISEKYTGLLPLFTIFVFLFSELLRTGCWMDSEYR